MVIIRDRDGNIIGKEPSARYVATRVLRNRREQELSDKQLGIVRSPRLARTQRLQQVNHARIERGLEPVFDNPGVRCGCEDYPACGH